MGKLFPGVPRIKNDPARIARLNPSIWLGFLPVVGGAITTPMQLGEVDRANDWQSAAQHFAKLLAVRGMREQLADTAGKPLGYAGSGNSNAVAVSRPETRVVVERHLQRRDLLEKMARTMALRRAVARPPLERRPVVAALAARLGRFTKPVQHGFAGKLAFQSQPAAKRPSVHV